MTISFNGTSGVTFPDASTQATAATGFGFKNRIINGAMMIDQRNAGASVTPTSSAYTVDRWQYAFDAASKMSVQQNAGSVTPPAGFKNYLGLTTVSAYTPATSDNFLLRQRIEGFNTVDFAWGTASATAVTLSFWVRSSLTGTFGGALSGASLNYVFSYTINSANTWEYKTVTIAGPTSGTWNTDNTSGIDVRFGLGNGATVSGAAGSWGATAYYNVTGGTQVVATNGATFYITGVQLEKSSTATSFDYRPYGTELALCQRYCQVLRGQTMLGSSSTGLYGDANSIQQIPMSGLQSTILRSPSTASLTMQGTQGTDWYISTSGGAAQTGFTITLGTNASIFVASKTSHGLTPSSTFFIANTTSGAAIISSEL